jgi:hypothetical protein
MIKQLEEDDRLYRLLNGNFDIDVFVERTEKGFVIHLDEAIQGLSCESCVHLLDEDCRGKNLIGEMVLDCLKQDSHRYCEDGISEIEMEDLDDMDNDL